MEGEKNLQYLIAEGGPQLHAALATQVLPLQPAHAQKEKQDPGPGPSTQSVVYIEHQNPFKKHGKWRKADPEAETQRCIHQMCQGKKASKDARQNQANSENYYLLFTANVAQKIMFRNHQAKLARPSGSGGNPRKPRVLAELQSSC